MAREQVLVDTWGWLALTDRREPRHAAVHALVSGLLHAGGSVVTTDYILDETFTIIFRRLPLPRARRFLTTIEQAEGDQSLHIERILPERFTRAKQLRLRFRDKPRISFTDLTTMAVMSELRLARIVTGDDHFRQVGLGLAVVP